MFDQHMKYLMQLIEDCETSDAQMYGRDYFVDLLFDVTQPIDTQEEHAELIELIDNLPPILTAFEGEAYLEFEKWEEYRFTATPTRSGNLLLTLLFNADYDDAVERFRQDYEERGEYALLYDLFDTLPDTYRVFSAAELEVLTGWDFIVGKDWDEDDNGELTRVGRVYWFPGYQVDSVIETLIEKGQCYWEGVE